MPINKQKNDWQKQVKAIEQVLLTQILPLNELKRVKNTRVLGSIGAVECHQSVNVANIQKRFVELGVWIRPFGKLIYIMPPYITEPEQLTTVIKAIKIVLEEDACFII